MDTLIITTSLCVVHTDPPSRCTTAISSQPPGPRDSIKVTGKPPDQDGLGAEGAGCVMWWPPLDPWSVWSVGDEEPRAKVAVTDHPGSHIPVIPVGRQAGRQGGPELADTQTSTVTL